ncbi:charged multivesicular body protein 4b-like [Poecilia reticulata]|uniref:charged multivesicular body protein 4b-like n=1 Tax=Poecilia reticulata TaxID=8081 RepID=UPI0004A2C01E|nr:PREDICTED: charged multivesicular body protein 4b-like [Poecilia reticulata]
MDLDLLCAKKHCGPNRRAALHALRRKRWYEKHQRYVDHAVQATRAASKNKEMTEVNNMIKGIKLEDDMSEVSGNLYKSENQEVEQVEFVEDELLAELERLKKTLDESLLEASRKEDKVYPSPVLSSASPSHPGTMEEDESESEVEDGVQDGAEDKDDEDDDDEEDLEYLRRWASESL